MIDCTAAENVKHAAGEGRRSRKNVTRRERCNPLAALLNRNRSRHVTKGTLPDAGSNGDMMLRVLIAFCAVALSVTASTAGAPLMQKAAIFPFELVIPPKEEDFFFGGGKPNPAEQARLKLVYDEFIRLMTASGRLAAVDLAPIAAEIEAKSPIFECKGCEIDLAKKVGADTAYIVVLEKASDTLLNLNLTEIDINGPSVTRRVSAVVNGNTDDAWLGIVRWVVRNRLLVKKEAAQ